MITLRSGDSVNGARVRIDPDHGSRIASLEVGGRQLLVTDSDDPLGWGCYPMVPFAGRLRRGRFTFAGRTFDLPLNLAPHAIHGTVFDSSWSIVSFDDTMAITACDLGHDWPFRARLEHRITLSASRLHLMLTLRSDETMPAQLGWHPWFVKPIASDLRFRAMHARDHDGIASPDPTAVPTITVGRVDDCFVDPQEILTLRYDDLVVTLESSCRHWVVFDEPDHATCVEPQSGPPDALNSDPEVIESGHELSHWFALSWSTI